MMCVVVPSEFRRILSVGMVTGVCFGFGAECLADVGSTGIATSEPFDMTSSMIRMLGGFLFCLGLFGAGIHLYKRYFMQSGSRLERRLKIVERLPVSPKNSLLLVELDGREFLLATGPDSPKMLVSNPKRDFSFDDTLLDASMAGDEINA